MAIHPPPEALSVCICRPSSTISFMFLQLLTGLVLGVVASLLAWLVLKHALRPKLAVSAFVSFLPKHNERDLFRVKIYNQRQTRTAVDIRASANVWLPGLDADLPDNNELVRLDVEPAEIVGLQPGGQKILYLSVAEEQGESLETVPLSHGFGSVIEALTYRLHGTETADGDPSEIRLWLSYGDGYSGTRIAELHQYKRCDVKELKFEEGLSVEEKSSD